MKITPMNNQVIVKPFEKSNETKSGITLVFANEGKPVKGEVISIGGKVQEVSVKDVIIFKKYAPDEIEIEGEKLLILSEMDVLAIIK